MAVTQTTPLASAMVEPSPTATHGAPVGTPPAVALRDVSFEYPLLGMKLSGLIGALARRSKAGPDPKAPPPSPVGGTVRVRGRRASVEALHDISLRIDTGQRLGIVGANGAGKSTLLRLIAGIYAPTAGTVRTTGRVAAIFGSAHGMDQELSGYENIRVRGLFLGRTDAEIRDRAREIAEFCELEDFLHLPLRIYSPGMAARLGFSISTAFRPDLLLLDEWLGVGDHRFTERARDRMKGFYKDAGTVVLASHNEKLIEQNCDSIVVMEKGRIIERQGC
ncbi:MAG: ABC-type polysaccharide/polyol phosphate transport system ATPase subunit [Phycisphaerales bacterium]